MRDPLDPRQAELTQFDKLAVQICIFGAAILVGTYVVFVDTAARGYRRGLGGLPSLSEIVYSPFYPASMAMLMLFLAYYGTRMRKLYDRSTASNVLFLGILTSIGANFVLLHSLFAPAGQALFNLGE